MSDASPWAVMQDSKMDQILRAWKSKSLNSMPTQKYRIPLQNTKKDDTSKKKNMKKQQTDSKVPAQSKPEMLPQPKITKIKDSIFCIYLNSQLIIFIFATQEQKLINRTKTTFRTINYSFNDTIKFVVGNNSDQIFVGLENQLHILGFKWVKQMTEEGKAVEIIKQVQKIDVKALPKLKGVGFVKQEQTSLLIAVSGDKLIKYNIDSSYKVVSDQKILFNNEKDQKTFNDIMAIQILIENNNFLYLFGTMEGVKQEMNDKYEGNARMRKCQFLYLFKFTLSERSIQTISIHVSMIDHVFETGIFGKSKIFQQGPSVFLISLHEEIIVVKYHFQKYVVWDNISLASSKSNQKKGQLILADKIVMVYTEMGEIFAHNIFFSFKQSKLKYPRIDNFKGNDNDEQILYDAIVLEYEPGSFMKVLFYFKEMEVYSPTNKIAIHKEDKNVGDHKQFLYFNILCIQQNSPLAKLGQLFKNKKTPQEISQFVQRFNIAELDKSKCQWSVSEKTEKDIENLLLDIKDNQYIQNQLTKILKAAPHDLKFLGRIEKKQIERYKKMLATKLLKNDQDSDPERLQKQVEETGRFFTKQQVEQIKIIIQWVMESIMFEKKLVYSKNFLEFMEYDFIEIGKLKAASLKEEIKLLSCKGFEKRLQYFLNSFKYMVLANFENIFQFLIEDKNQQEIQKFFLESFPFILPKFEQASEIFKGKMRANETEKANRNRRTSFAPIYFQVKEKQQKVQEDNCQLWEDKFNDENQIRKIETKESFRKQIEYEIQQGIKAYKAIRDKEKQKSRKMSLKQCLREDDAKKQFSIILDEFVKQNWFINNKSKQHSIIELDVDQLKQKMKYLKRIGVFHLLIKFFYQKIAKTKYKQPRVDEILEKFKNKSLIPDSFQYNILVRRQVYFKIQQNKKPNVALPILENFLVYEETQLFEYLFKYYRQYLLKDVKKIYDKLYQGFFKEKFQIYLNSDEIVLSEVINFLDQFQSEVIDKTEVSSNDQIRMDVFNCIKKLLKVNDKQNILSFVAKLMDKEILKNQGGSQGGKDSLIDEAKVTFGCYFYDLFYTFQIQQTYKELIEQTNVEEYEQCRIIKTMLEKYCSDDYIGADQQLTQSQLQGEYEGVIIKFQERYNLEQIQFPLNNEPLEFFGIILYLIDTLRFEIKNQTVFDKFVELLLEVEKYDELVYFIDCFRRDIGGEDSQASQQHIQQQFKTRNYQLLKEFYHNGNIIVKDRVIENILMWVRRQYKQGLERMATLPPSYTKEYNDRFQRITKTFEQVIDKLRLESAEIVREKSFLNMLKNIKEIEPRLISYILKQRFQKFNGNYLQQNSALLNELSSFIFMIRFLKVIPKEKFDQFEPEIINREILLMEHIYFQFQSASRYHHKPEEESGLIRFYMELAMRLIQDKQFLYCKHVILKIIQNQYYFRDVFFQFMAWINQNQGKPASQDFKDFIKNFIQTTHEKNMIHIFNSFVSQNGIQQFQGTTTIKNESQDLTASIKWTSDKLHVNSYKQSSKDVTENRKKMKGSSLFNDKQDRGNKLMDKLMMLGKPKLAVTKQEHLESSHFAIQIFEALLQSHRIDEAYYFLVRNTLLSVTQAKYLDYSRQKTDSYALISIYLKCLQNYLCTEFYPTFTFYRNKHTMLLNQYQRKDIIKDINIAISRLKEMLSDLKLKIGQFMKAMDNGKNLLTELVGKELIISPTDVDQETRKSEESKTSKLQQQQASTILEDLKQKQRGIEEKLNELTKLYDTFMRSNGLDPNIKLNEQQIAKGNLKLDNMSRQITPDQLSTMNINRERSFGDNYPMRASPRFETNGFTAEELSRKFGEEEAKVKSKVKQDPRFAQLEKQVVEKIRQSKMVGDNIQHQSSQLKPPPQFKSKNSKVYNDLKQKQKRDLDSIKESFKSQASQRVHDILEQLRLRKSKIYDKSDVKSRFSGIDIDDSEPRSRQNSVQTHGNISKRDFEVIPEGTDLLPPPDLRPYIQRENSGTESMATNQNDMNISRKYEVKLHGVDGNTRNIYMPVTMSKQSQKNINSRLSVANNANKPQSYIDQLKLKTQSNIKNDIAQSQRSYHMGTNQTKSRVATTLPDLIRLFEEKEPQCKKYVQKLEFVKNNMQVGLQITKNIYSTVNNFEVFVRYLGFLLQNSPKYKQVFEEKAYKIAQQAMGIEYKINLKQLFPIDLFTQVKNVSQKQYYKTAYQTMRPNLMKILARPETNVHGIAVLYRFGFGSDNVYYYKVYEDYIKVLLKEYNENVMDQKKLFLLAEKLRTLYNNISSDNRQSKFEQFMREIPIQSKRKALGKEMLKILDRRSEMLTGEKQSDLKDILVRIV